MFFLSYLRAQQVYLIESLEHPVAAALNRDKIKREEIQGVLFILSPSMVSFSHRTPGIFCTNCLKKGQDKERGNTWCPFYHISEHGRIIS